MNKPQLSVKTFSAISSFVLSKYSRISLSSSPFYASLAVTLTLGVFIGIFWAFNEYGAYRASIGNIRKNYRERYESRVKEEVGQVLEFVDYKRSQADLFIESEIREKVQAAYSIASHLYSQHKDELSLDELRENVVEVLRPIRWRNGRGYYFAGRLDDGTIDLFADDPYLEGKTYFSFKEDGIQKRFSDISEIARDKGAGIYRSTWIKPEEGGLGFPKVSFVKYFKPFNWYIGASIYLDDMERILQEDVLARVKNMQFGEDGEIFGFRFDGTIICHRDDRFVGRSMRDIVGYKDVAYGKEIWKTGLNENNDGYVSYAVSNSDLGKVFQKLSYVEPYDDWGWLFAATMYMDDMDNAIEYERKTYLNITFKNISLFLVLLLVAVSMMLFVAYVYSMKIKDGISLFTNFFRKAADEKIKIEHSQLVFSEFENMATYANQMVDDRVHKEQLLRRNELRLDTLLELGLMNGDCIQDKYDFVLSRIVQITRSESGYLALVNQSQTHLNLYSYYDIKEQGVVPREFLGSGVNRRHKEAGVPGAAVSQKKAVICNSYENEEGTEPFPYNKEVIRHLDVPIFNSGIIVLVAGVCNNPTDYDNTDIRQMTMLLEGLWLHILKTCSEKEMARLERQIIAVSVEERSTIGRDLHDDLGSHLSGVELLSKVLQKKLEKDAKHHAESLGTIRDLIRDAIDKTRRLALGLYPVHVVEHGLVAAIEEIQVEIENMFGVVCTLSLDNLGQQVDKNVAIHMYYIIREAAFNAARHGRPDTIHIILKRDESTLLVRIEDDGCGFNSASSQEGIGLHTMKYRAKAIGAALKIDSEKSKGTVIEISGEVI